MGNIPLCLVSIKVSEPRKLCSRRKTVVALSANIEKFGFQDVFESNGKVVTRWAHKSEPGFSWFAGLLAFSSDNFLKAEPPK